MLLCLDVGNSQLYGGVFRNDDLVFQFRRSTGSRGSSDELGLFLRAVLRENDVDPKAIDEIAICSVVPDYVYSLRACCEKYFRIEPLSCGRAFAPACGFATRIRRRSAPIALPMQSGRCTSFRDGI